MARLLWDPMEKKTGATVFVASVCMEVEVRLLHRMKQLKLELLRSLVDGGDRIKDP